MGGLCVGLEGFSKGHGLLRGAAGTGRVADRHWARGSAGRPEVFGHQLDEVGGEDANCPPVAP